MKVTSYKIQEDSILLEIDSVINEILTLSKDFNIHKLFEEARQLDFNNIDDLMCYISDFNTNQGERVSIVKDKITIKISRNNSMISSIEKALKNSNLTENERSYYFEKQKEYATEKKTLEWVLNERCLFE